jgi:hypothetical protein
LVKQEQSRNVLLNLLIAAAAVIVAAAIGVGKSRSILWSLRQNVKRDDKRERCTEIMLVGGGLSSS